MKSHVSMALGVAASAAAILTSPVDAQYASNNTACTRHYKVVSGDTCDIIGQKTMTSTYQIMALNLPQSGPSCYTLQIGADLCLGRFGTDCQLVHRVANDESCGSIARQYGISVKTLHQNNPSMNCDELYSGLMLCTLDGLVRPTTDPALPLYYAAPKAGQMPLGTAIVAKNPPPAPVVSSSSLAASASASVPSSSSTSGAPSSSSPSASASTAPESKVANHLKHNAHRHNHHH